MQKKIQFIFALLAITLCSCLKGNESLELQSITGLSESETMRFLVDRNEAFPDAKAYKIEKGFQIPKGPYYISVYYDCIWDGSKGYYLGQHLTVSIEDGKHYRDNPFPKKFGSRKES